MIYQKHFLCLLLILVNLFGCNRSINRKLTETELVGEWKITDDSIEFLQNNNICCASKETKLILSDDKKFSLINMSSCWVDDVENCADRTLDFEGIWLVYTSENNSNTLILNGLTSRGMSLIERSGKIQIIFDYGDPDSGRGIYLSK